MLRALAVVLATGLTILVSWLAESLPLWGRTTGAIAALYANPFTPAGYVFSIWGLIYLGQCGHAVLQVRAALRGDRRLEPVVGPSVLAAGANIGWMLCWHALQVVGAMLLMLVLLLALVVAYRRLQRIAARGLAERVFVHGSFSVYLGWICVATLANLAALVVALGGPPFGISPGALAAGLLLLATAVFAAVGRRTGDWLYVGVFAWAVVGIALRAGQPPLVSTLAWAGIALVAGAVGWNRRPRTRLTGA